MPEYNATILLIDDTPSIIDSVSTALEEEGFTVFIANSGEKALERLEHISPDLILLDILMPGMDGYETCNKIHKKTDKKIPVIFLSALTDPFDKVKAFESGAVDYVTKPIEITELYTRINTHVALKRNRESLERKNSELQHALHELSETQNLLIQQTRFAVAGEVINNIAHQWRQPLHVIALWTDETRLRLEENGIDTALYDEAIEHILDTTQSLSHTINDMARLFRSSEPTTRFNICDQIHATLALMRDKFDEADIRVSCESCEAIEVQNYPNAFSQALMHILNNTVDSLKESETEKKIVFTVRRSEEKGRNAVITITDSGKGIDPAIFEKMFEPYTTTKFKHFGTGLSLYISKLIIEKNMQGLLYAQNSDKGALFFIEL